MGKIALCRQYVDARFADADVIIAPAAQGEAPEGLKWSGDPIFNRIWTRFSAIRRSYYLASSGPKVFPWACN